ncbi:MAG: sulfite exporter TauE/SafE family protein [Phascolarctobacterium sp.]|uniref:sulfite exporter TauE/SafE family protein n=1 Tax=Phascolarctobacterium sp. TaxID=2049039 RepID=UPI0026DD6DAC|nr:sulfite exporter TauE/SafE family protein [Phascolarctobacterium sp.]MDO4921870.1 sulfite exporter TauE/SafE family protein [Phascolarctobacterium sp.]
MELLSFLIVGVGVGLLGSLLGIGGGIVIVPLLVFYCGYEPQAAIGTSVLVVLLNAISGTLGYMRKRQVCLDAALKFALATVPGAFLGSYAAEYLQGRLFYFLFGFFFIFVAYNMFTKANKNKKAATQDNAATQAPENYNWQLGVACSVGVGFLASILGIGGGIIHVPFMAYVLKFPVHVAIATSTCILAVSSLAGVISHGFLGHIMWLVGLCIGAGAFIGAQIGVQIAQRLQASYLLKFSSVLVFLTGLKFLLSSF